jgi:phenylacetate-CoA ligase
MNAHGARIHVHRYGAPFRQRLAEFSALERAGRGKLDFYQSRQLQRVVRAALAGSSYYRALFADLGMSEESIQAPADLVRLPILTKNLLRERERDVVTAPSPQRGWMHGHTSGTTGSPLSLWYDRETCIATNAGDRLQKRWAGVADHEWVGLLLGRQVVPSTVTTPPFWHANHAQRQVWFSSLHMSEATLALYAQEIRRRKLTVMEGYPSTLYVLARYLLERGERLPLRAVFSSSETLLATQREAIETAFAAPLFDFYGHAERAIFAIECDQHQGKHLVEPFGITEIVDEHDQPVPDGQFGYMVGTSLFNRAMPMLRYRTGDISAIDRTPCPCGRTFVRMADVSTKAEDIVVLPDGRWLSPSALTHPFKPFPDIRESQIIQESVGEIVVKVVASDAFTAEREAELQRGLRERLGAGVDVRLERVAHIDREKSGKFRWVISRVPHSMKVTWQ